MPGATAGGDARRVRERRRRIPSGRHPSRSYLDDVRAAPGPAVVGAIVCVGWLLVGVGIGSEAVARYAVSVPVLVGGVVVANHHVRLSHGVLWGFVAWELAHMAGGRIPVGDHHILYNAAWGIPLVRWDRLVPAFGFGLATAASWEAIRRLLPRELWATRAVVFLAALCGLAFGAVIEVLEFLLTLVTPTNVGDYVDTGWDLVADSVGAAAAAIWLRLRGGTP